VRIRLSIRRALRLAAIVLPLLPLAAAAIAAPQAPAEETEDLTIITYNVLEGFRRGESAEAAAAWLKEQQPDVAALQELMDLDREDFAALARKWGHPYAAMHKYEGHPVGLTSVAPIRIIERRTEGMHHGYLHAQTLGIHFFVLHLAPGRQRLEKRKEEAPILMQAIQPLLDAGEPVVVLGDFNDLSPLDPLPNIRGEQLREWDYEVMQTFLDAGLVDAAHLAASRENRHPTNTCPTRMGEGERTIEESSWRIDYVLLDENLAESLREAYTPRIEALDEISDHYPVVVRLKR
jgi:exonuclease III